MVQIEDLLVVSLLQRHEDEEEVDGEDEVVADGDGDVSADQQRMLT